MPALDELIPLPNPEPPTEIWPAQVREAYSLLQKKYHHAAQVVHQTRSDQPTRLLILAEELNTRGGQILDTMTIHRLPEDWIEAVALTCAMLLTELETAAEIGTGRIHARARKQRAYTLVRTGKRGRPAIHIPEPVVREAFDKRRNITIAALARALGVERTVLKRHMDMYGVTRQFDDLSDEELDSLVAEFHQDRGTSGERYLAARLRARGIKIQRERIRKAAKRVYGASASTLRKPTIQRRKFVVDFINAIWSGDGHHKLIKYGIVGHGFIEAYSRLIVALRWSTNNRASTVLEVFKSGVAKYGLPSRVRGDRGGENIKVAVYMTMRRGADRGSYLWGGSMHNTRIERLWVEVGSQFVRRWKVFFKRLEAEYGLIKTNKTHLWLLHHLFLQDINEDSGRFQEDWNRHGVSGEVTQSRAPEDIFFLDAFSVGKCDDSDAAEIPSELDTAIMTDKRSQVNHDPLQPASSSHPFGGSAAWEALFDRFMVYQAEENYLPRGYGFHGAENKPWDDMDGLRVGKKEELIPLPHDPWWFRAVVWVRGLEGMTHIWEEMDSVLAVGPS